MKKIKAFLIAMSMILSASAQDTHPTEAGVNPEFFRICASIFIAIAFMVFFLAILKRMLEYRIKNKIVERGVSETLAASLLRPGAGEGMHANIKWFALLAAIGGGLLIVDYTLPLGFHSLAIMALSTAVGFLGYFIYLKKWGK